MAFKLGELVWEITGDNSGAKRALAQTEKGIEKTGKSASKMGKIFKLAFAVAIVAAIAKAGKALIKAASDAEETNSKFGVVFSGVIDKANEMANVLSTQYGLARTESKTLLSATGDLLAGFGVAQDKALDLSYRVQTLAVDLASFSNFAGGATGASEALTKALLGETESAKALGLALNETALRAFAEEQGKVFKNLTLQEKMFLRLDLAVSQSGNAIGDFSLTMDSYANQVRIATANNRNLAETYGKALLPLATLGIKLFNENAKAMQESADAFADFVTSAEGARQIGDIIGGIAGAFQVLKIIAFELIKPFQAVVDALGEAGDELSTIFDDTVEAGTSMSILSGLTAVTAASFKLLAISIAGGIKIIVDLVRILVESGGVVASFYRAIRGKASWDEFQEQIGNAGTSYQKLGSTIVDTTKKLFTTFKEEVDGFGDNQQKLASDIEKTFAGTQGNVSSTIQKVLTAQQEVAQAQAQQNEKAKKDTGDLAKEYAKVIAAQSQFAAAFGQGSIESFKAFSEISTNIQDIATTYAVATGEIVNLLGALDTYQQALSESRVGRINEELQAELEAAGLAEDSAVQAAEREVARANREGSEEEQRLAGNALKKAQIEEKYAQKIAETEYEAALKSWELQRAMAAIKLVTAPLNAYVSSLAAPWPWNMILAPINAALAAATAGIQYAAVVESKPQKPAFQFGGIVPGSSFAGDNVDVAANSDEMIITQQQQKRLFNIANGDGGGRQGMYRVLGTKEVFLNELFQASQNGDLFIAERAVVTR